MARDGEVGESETRFTMNEIEAGAEALSAEARRRLRAAMARLEALASASAVSEAMRRDEPSHLSAALGEAAAESGGAGGPPLAPSARLGGLAALGGGTELEEQQQQQAAVEAVDASSAAPAAKRARRAWAPWKAGTKGHAALAELAATREAGAFGGQRAAPQGRGRSELRLLG